ncbi:hypothetical protein ACHAWU_001470 [Discostella pseudostelligera]|uniref:WRKY transcription factor 19 n=1 Tax=Discostella pseudostelligera TaxID=259834 RepID=A0ABD3M4T1_9STRA
MENGKLIGGGGGAAASATSSGSGSSKRDNGKKPKRIRRKCAFENCENRVVQGGVCVTHGAKRKLCSFPNCDKAVKLAGYCSTHGPSRRKCGTEGCTRVAVQGGRCLSHGARRRLCSYPGSGGSGKQCQKNAIMGGMCKKHYDRMQDAEGMLVMSLCMPVISSGNTTNSLHEEGSDDAAVAITSGNGGFVSGGSSSKSEGGGGESELESPAWVANKGSGSGCNGAVAIVASSATSSPTLPTIAYQEEAHHQAQSSSSVPPLPTTSVHNGSNTDTYHHFSRPHKKMKPSSHHKPSHTRGLSIFDDLSTVDAIISSGAENRAHEVVPAYPPPPPPPPQVLSAPAPALPMPPSQQQQQQHHQQGFPPPKLTNKISSTSSSSVMPPSSGVLSSIKTPTVQVSFADTRLPATNKTTSSSTSKARTSSNNNNNNHRPSSSTSNTSDDEPCTGNSSCVCKACRSPTLAIFEQMLEASHKIERAEVEMMDPNSDKYAGLSPPKLSNSSGTTSGGGSTSNNSANSPRKSSWRMVRQGSDSMTPKNVSFVPDEEPTSCGSVVRKVSSSNIVGEEQQTRQGATTAGGGDAFGEQREGGPASHALAQQQVESSEVSRTVSAIFGVSSSFVPRSSTCTA